MRFLAQLFLLATLVLFSCRKDDKLPDNALVPEILGTYKGHNYYSTNGSNTKSWTLYSPKITEYDSHSVKINGWSNGIKNIITEVKGTKLTITDQIDTITTHAMGGTYVYHSVIKLNGTGTYYPEINSIYLNYIQEWAPLGSNDFDTSKIGYISIMKNVHE